MTSEQNQEALQSKIHRIEKVLVVALVQVQKSIRDITSDMEPRTRLALVLC